MVGGIHFVFDRVLFNAHTGTYKKENDQRFGGQINNARQDHECDMVGMQDREIKDALNERRQQK